MVAYDPAWADGFERIRSFVWSAVRDVALSVEHVGSTSVPGLAAKAVIDVCVVVASREDVPPCIERLAGIGYEHRGDLGVPGREAFRAPVHLPKQHMYLSHRNNVHLKNHLGLRDHLRAHPDAARTYGDLKIALAERFPDDIDSYIEGKSEFILGVLRAIGLVDDELAEIERVNENVRRP